MQSKPLYYTVRGQAYAGDSLELLAELPDNSIDLVMTSPPFALRRQKTYGNVEETEYVQWIKPFGQEVFRVLNENGSFVLDLGGSITEGQFLPTSCLYRTPTAIQATSGSAKNSDWNAIRPDSLLTSPRSLSKC